MKTLSSFVEPRRPPGLLLFIGVQSALALVRLRLPLVRNPLALVGNCLALIRDAITLGGDSIVRLFLDLDLIGPLDLTAPDLGIDIALVFGAPFGLRIRGAPRISRDP